MRKLVTLGVLVIGLMIGWLLKRAPAATGSVDPVVVFHQDLHAGDTVRLYLTPSKSGIEYLEGTLQSFDGSSFALLGQTGEMCAKDHVVGTDERQVLSVVPQTSVLFVQKTISEKFIPATQP